jgi:hypothetical protein
MVSIHFSGKTIFLLILITASAVLIPFLNQNQLGLAQQQQNNQTSSSLTNEQQQPTGTYFQIDNTTFSHHMTVVNGVQIHYVIGGHGDPVVLLHGWPATNGNTNFMYCMNAIYGSSVDGLSKWTRHFSEGGSKVACNSIMHCCQHYFVTY